MNFSSHMISKKTYTKALKNASEKSRLGNTTSYNQNVLKKTLRTAQFSQSLELIAR